MENSRRGTRDALDSNSQHHRPVYAVLTQPSLLLFSHGTNFLFVVLLLLLSVQKPFTVLHFWHLPSRQDNGPDSEWQVHVGLIFLTMDCVTIMMAWGSLLRFFTDKMAIILKGIRGLALALLLYHTSLLMQATEQNSFATSVTTFHEEFVTVTVLTAFVMVTHIKMHVLLANERTLDVVMRTTRHSYNSESSV